MDPRITDGRADILRLGRSVNLSPKVEKVVAVAAQQACLNLAWSVLTDQQAGKQASKQGLSVATQAMQEARSANHDAISLSKQSAH